MKLLEQIKSGKVFVSEGAMGTELQKQGYAAGTCAEELVVTQSTILENIHQRYYEAGADIAITNTFGANQICLKKYGFENRVNEFNKAAVKIARQVYTDRFVAGSIGPSGGILQPLGDLAKEELVDIFREQAIALAGAGADVIFVETMMSAEEMEIAVKAVKGNTDLPVSASMTFDVGPSGIHTQWGVDVHTFIKRAEQAGADIIGSNCGKGFDEMIQLIEQLRPITDLPVIAQANAGLPKLVDGRHVYSETPESIVPKVKKLLKLGVNIIGGCCGTGPEHIIMIRNIVNNYK